MKSHAARIGHTSPHTIQAHDRIVIVSLVGVHVDRRTRSQHYPFQCVAFDRDCNPIPRPSVKEANTHQNANMHGRMEQETHKKLQASKLGLWRCRFVSENY